MQNNRDLHKQRARVHTHTHVRVREKSGSPLISHAYFTTRGKSNVILCAHTHISAIISRDWQLITF